MRSPQHPATEDIQLTEVLRALSDPVRLEILGRLAREGHLYCFELGAEMDLHKSTLSHHYRILREAGVTHTSQEGRRKRLTLRRDDLDARFPGLLDSILAAV